MIPVQTEWGWLLIWDFFLAGAGAGAYIVGVLADYLGEKNRIASKVGVFLSAPLVIGGVLFLMLDLGRPERFMSVFGNFGSLIAIGSVFITAFLVVSVIHIGLWIWPFKLLEKATVLRRALGIIGVVLALGVMTYPGVAMSLAHVSFWETGLLPLLFIGVALMTGTAATVMVLGVYQARSVGEANEQVTGMIRTLVTPLLALGVFVLAVLFFYTVTASMAPSALESRMLLTSGSFSALFWGGLIVAGLILPIALLGLGVKNGGRLPLLAALSSLLLLTGGLLVRYLVVAAGVPEAADLTPQTYFPAITPQAFDYMVVGVFFLILVAAYFVAAKIIPTTKLTTAIKKA